MWRGDLFGTCINRPWNGCPESGFFISRLEFNGGALDSYLRSSTGVFRGRFICGISENDLESDDRCGYVGILPERVKSPGCVQSLYTLAKRL